jgi:hypothetical protein
VQCQTGETWQSLGNELCRLVPVGIIFSFDEKHIVEGQTGRSMEVHISQVTFPCEDRAQTIFYLLFMHTIKN